jgi:DNA-binding LytR/AlgR family response regulator
MNLLIIEDEPASALRLKKMVQELDPEIRVGEIIDSISSAVEYFRTHSAPDLVLMDIHLADGLSFEIFKEAEVNCPVIFTTAYDQYALQAFKVNSIDYLMKPVKKQELDTAVAKYRRHHKAKTGHQTSPEDQAMIIPAKALSDLAALLTQQQKEHLNRLVIRIGQQIKVLEVKDLAYFYIEEKIVFAVNFKGDRYPVDLSLDHLEEQLDPVRYFRINRGFIVSLESIEAMYTYSKARIKIRLKPRCELETITSTERSAGFRDWLKGR